MLAHSCVLSRVLSLSLYIYLASLGELQTDSLQYESPLNEISVEYLKKNPANLKEKKINSYMERDSNSSVIDRADRQK